MLKGIDRIQEFLDAAYVRSHSEETVKSYRNCLKKFEKFTQEKFDCSLEEIVLKLKAEKYDVYEVLRDFVVFQDKIGFMPRTIDLAVNAAKGYLRHCGIKIYTEDFKHVVRLPKKVKSYEIPLTKEILIRLLRNVSPKLQTVILVAVSSGMRIGELVQITIKDIDFDSTPTKIRIRAETTKTLTTRDCFITAEATKALKDYLQRYHEWIEGGTNPHIANKPIFGRTSISKRKLQEDKILKHSKVLASKSLLQKTLEKAIETIPDLSTKNENGKHAIHFHAFRKFFRTTVGNVCGRDFAEAVIGHRFYLDTYYQIDEDQKKELYQKAEPYLTISDFAKIEKDVKTLSVEFLELKKEHEELKQYMRLNSIPGPEHFLKN